MGCERQWYYFLASSLVPYFSFLILLGFLRLYHVRRRQQFAGFTFSLRSAFIARRVVSLKCPTGKILAAVEVFFNTGSFIVYVRETIRTADEPFLVERCGGLYSDGWFIADVIFNLYFLVYFVLRFLSATDKLVFWIKVSSIIDFATVPPIILSLALNQLWIGLSFFRMFRLLELPKLLEAWKVVKSKKVLQTIEPVMSLVTLWIVGASFVHLLENTGDPWEFDKNSYVNQQWSYFEALYMIAVTMSTVGYGDYFAITYLGRIFMIFFIVGGLALFASYVPAIVDYIGQRNKYAGAYKRVTENHIVVCGHVTTASMETFLQDFFHEDRNENGNTTVVFLDNDHPDVKMKSILRYYSLGAEYYEGSVLNSVDLERVQLSLASACIILADKNSLDPNEEDSENLMRAVAVKNHHPKIRVIMQMLLQKNKKLVDSIPSFQPNMEDDVICVNEITLSLIAQSCLCPGFSTLLANMIGIRSAPDELPLMHSAGLADDWKDSYFQGCGYDFYPAQLSAEFTGMTFQSVAEICYTKWSLLLLGVENPSDLSGQSRVYINPSDENFVLKAKTKGFFLAHDEDDTESATYFTNEESFVKGLITSSQRRRSYSPMKLRNTDSKKQRQYNVEDGVCIQNPMFATGNMQDMDAETRDIGKEEVDAVAVDANEVDMGDLQLDSTKSYYYHDFVDFEDALLKPTETVCSGHIVVCIFGNESSCLIGLKNLLIPLRAANLHGSEMKQIVFLGSEEYLRREGSALEKEDLCRVSVNSCSMCVFLTAAGRNEGTSSDVFLNDKESVLGTLTLKTMTFDCREDGQGVTRGIDVPVLTDLGNDSNVQFLDQTDEDSPNASLFETQAFAFGNAISASIVDSTVSSVYADSNIMTLLGMLLNLGTDKNNSGQQQYCRVVQKSFFEAPFSQFKTGSSFGQMFVSLLRAHGLMCLGLYRRYVPKPESPERRYVITLPAFEYPLRNDDFVFVLLPPSAEPEMSTI